MQSFLAFLQIIQILGRMTIWLVRNYQITLVSILFIRILQRIGKGEGNLGAVWDFFYIMPLLIWIYRSYFINEQKQEKYKTSVNIKKTNIIKKTIVNSQRELGKVKRSL